MISSQVPLAMASKTLRHSTLSFTVDTYGHWCPTPPNKPSMRSPKHLR
jgi:hypothetical protein